MAQCNLKFDYDGDRLYHGKQINALIENQVKLGQSPSFTNILNSGSFISQLGNLTIEQKNLINLYTYDVLDILANHSKQPYTQVTREWLKTPDGQAFMNKAKSYQAMLDGLGDESNPKKIYDATQQWIKENPDKLPLISEKREPNLEEIKHILRKSVWTCIACEASNSYTLTNCEVCDTERYFSFEDVKILMLYF
jgi:hypothetical protein